MEPITCWELKQVKYTRIDPRRIHRKIHSSIELSDYVCYPDLRPIMSVLDAVVYYTRWAGSEYEILDVREDIDGSIEIIVKTTRRDPKPLKTYARLVLRRLRQIIIAPYTTPSSDQPLKTDQQNQTKNIDIKKTTNQRGIDSIINNPINRF